MTNDITKFKTPQQGPCAYCYHWTTIPEALASYALYGIRLCPFCIAKGRHTTFAEVAHV